MKNFRFLAILAVLVVSFSCNDQTVKVEPSIRGAARLEGEEDYSQDVELLSLYGLTDADIYDGEDRSNGFYEWDEGVFLDPAGNSPTSTIKPGKLHKRTSQCAVFKAMLAASFDNGQTNGNPVRENVALITQLGVIWLPSDHNQARRGYLDYYHYRKDSDGTRSVSFNNQWIKVLAVIHTHPNRLSEGPSIATTGKRDDFSVVTYFKAPNFVINWKSEIWEGYIANNTKQSLKVVAYDKFMNCDYNVYNLL